MDSSQVAQSQPQSGEDVLPAPPPEVDTLHVESINSQDLFQAEVSLIVVE